MRLSIIGFNKNRILLGILVSIFLFSGYLFYESNFVDAQSSSVELTFFLKPEPPSIVSFTAAGEPEDPVVWVMVTH